MSKFKKALEKLRRNKKTSKYDDLVWVAKQVGFVLDRQNSSHAIFINEEYHREFTFVKHSNGIAQHYNVNDLLSFIDDNDLGEGEK